MTPAEVKRLYDNVRPRAQSVATHYILRAAMTAASEIANRPATPAYIRRLYDEAISAGHAAVTNHPPTSGEIAEAEALEAGGATREGARQHGARGAAMTRHRSDNEQVMADLLAEQTTARTRLQEQVTRLTSELEIERHWWPLTNGEAERGWVVVTGEEEPGRVALFPDEQEARDYLAWRAAQEAEKDEDDRDPSWEYAQVLPAEYHARFWNSFDDCPPRDGENDEAMAPEVQPISPNEDPEERFRGVRITDNTGCDV